VSSYWTSFTTGPDRYPTADVAMAAVDKADPPQPGETWERHGSHRWVRDHHPVAGFGRVVVSEGAES
jgi:hypothetical protein